MKIERIACNKLKITVYPEDLMLHGLSFESFTPESPRVQDFFWSIIQKAETEADFEIEEGRVIIEAMSLKNDGLVIFLTKPEGPALPEHVKLRRVRYRVKAPRAQTHLRPVRIYRFETFDDLCALVRLWQYGDDIRSSLFSLKNAYILTLSIDKSTASGRSAEMQLLEFASPMPEITEAYLEEHAHKICDGDAITAIRRYF